MARVCEIIESAEESKVGMISFPSSEHKYSIEDDINRLFESFNLRNPSRSSGISTAALKKNPSKKPMRSCSSPSTGIGISEQASLKQALRGLCISQASEMAAMKRFSKSMNSSKQFEAGNIKKLYRTLQTNGSGISGSSIKGKGESTTTIVEVSLVPEITDSNPPIQNDNFNEELRQETSVGPVVEAILVEEVVAVEGSVSSVVSNDEIKGEANSSSAFSETRVKKSSIFGNKNFTKKKMKHDSQKGDLDPVPKPDCHESSVVFNGERREKGNSPSRNTQKKKKAEFSQSSKSSIGESSSSTSISEASNLSSSSRCGSRPHMSRDLRWEAIKSVEKQHGAINLRHFKLLKSLGCGDIGTVYLAELVGSGCLFALKVMENEFLKTRKKMLRAKTEKEIMQMLDHPFLPTLYCHFTTDKLSCLVMECCPGGDLHVLRQKQPARCFYEQAARFYVAEVLLALEYLHMLGVVYRDLKPENILVREDGHIMLSDFDLSLRCSPNNVLVSSSLPCKTVPPRNASSPCTESSSCVDPFCLHPSWQVPCFTPGLSIKSRKLKQDYLGPQVSPLPQLVVEPTGARSNSFVGTHEYLAPEIVRGDGHGAAVDWWTFGVFLFELLYGKTPFKGSSNEETLSNVVTRSLKFPSSPVVSFHARDLIRGLLVKDPESRLGSSKGATEIKQHGFFEGLNWALIRCAVPPELPKSFDFRAVSRKNEAVEFEVF